MSLVFPNQNKNLKLNIIGAGSEREKLESLTKKLGVEKNVVFHGYQNKSFIAEILSSSEAFLMCTHHEPFGIPVVEALACGCPVVSTKCGGPEEIHKVVPGIHLVERDDYEQMTMELENILNNSASNEERRELLRGKAIESYGTRNIRLSWMNMYSELTGCL